MAPATPDDGFHEIQLNGKQLVFLFMAATVVSVVIFLCGVLVGRGVRAERGATPDATVASSTTPADISPTQPPAPMAAPPSSADPTMAAPPPPAEDTYFKRLEDPKPSADDVKAASAKAAAAAPPAPAPAPASNPKNAATTAKGANAAKATAPAMPSPAKSAPAAPAADTPAASAPAAGAGFAVQVAALNVRNEADAIAKHLVSKGYTAYVSSNSGTPTFYRVRVGTFKTRREAETVAAKLQKEEQMQAFITR